MPESLTDRHVERRFMTQDFGVLYISVRIVKAVDEEIMQKIAAWKSECSGGEEPQGILGKSVRIKQS